ncbi:MAG: hypothetical protein KGL39_06215 [Patescibacteria group bacterium]|nr:hypothetical protein [Patescibacteria group bacterium]
MGEIAEMMLDGTLCEGCGEYIDDGGASGFPRYCSPQCARNAGATPEQSERDKPFIVKAERAFGALRYWLKERDCNTYSHSDRKHIQVGYDSKPDSDWGKYTNRGFIVVCNEALFDRTLEEIAKAFVKNNAYGWTNI